MRLSNLAYHEYHLLFINNNGSGRSESWKRRKAIKTSKVLLFVCCPKHIIQHSLFPKDTSYHGMTILNTDFKHCSRVCHKIFRILAKPCTVISLLWCKCDILLVSKLVSPSSYLYSWWRWACLLIGKPNFQISCEKFSLYSHFCLCSPLFPLANEATLR